jgi:poly-gamma-glutamate capsule biosynthesis protein CapA/YwtB (metallophosphatase superfamily)
VRALILTALLCASAAAAAEPVRFPWKHTPETGVPGYLQFRAEGLSLAQAAKQCVSYMRKWKYKKWSAPVEELAWFAAQRQLLRYLRDEPVPAGPTTRLGAAGDLMWIRSQWNRFVTPEALASLARHDVLLANLETPIARSQSVPSLMPDYRLYNSDPGLVRSFRGADGRSLFSALATANNHSLDSGDAGALETLGFLDEEGIPHSGTAARGGRRWVAFEKNGIKFGFYAATWGLNDPASLASTKVQINVLPGFAPERPEPADLTEIGAALAEMTAAGCDVRAVYLHWGFEYEYYPSPKLMQEAERVVALGADLVFGMHSHVQQPPQVCFVNGYEKKYAADLPALKPETGCLLTTPDGRPRKALIVYSLGNFVTTMYSDITKIAWIPSLTLARDPATGAVDWYGLSASWLYNRTPSALGGTRKLAVLEKEPTPFSELNDPWVEDGTLTPLAWLKRHVGAE